MWVENKREVLLLAGVWNPKVVWLGADLRYPFPYFWQLKKHWFLKKSFFFFSKNTRETVGAFPLILLLFGLCQVYCFHNSAFIDKTVQKCSLKILLNYFIAQSCFILSEQIFYYSLFLEAQMKEHFNWCYFRSSISICHCQKLEKFPYVFVIFARVWLL